jgi:secreted trypsin-like serine protease
MFKSIAILFFIASSSALIPSGDGISKFIVGGEKAREGQFPHTVSLRIIEPINVHGCGGSILNSRWIVTVRNLEFPQII